MPIRAAAVPIIICTYGRQTQLRDKTLRVLQECKISPGRVHVVVASAKERRLYLEALAPGTFGHIHVASVGLARARNWVARHFPADQPLMFIDDDIRAFKALRRDGTLRPVSDLDAIIQRGFDGCSDLGLRLWGMYPVCNGMFMKQRMRWGNTFVCGAAYGVLNDRAQLREEELEDFERCGMHCERHGGVLRFEDVAYETAYHAAGGMKAEGRPDRVRAAADAAPRLVARFPAVFGRCRTVRNGQLNPVFLTRENRVQSVPCLPAHRGRGRPHATSGGVV